MSVDIPGPASDVQLLVSEAKSLVYQLYDPANTGNPAKIKVIQEQLQSLQKSPQAWQIANDLLTDANTDLRFFGALTFTVKINNDWQNLSPEDGQELLGRLIDHFVFLVNAGERPFVIRKLASSLATIFLKPNAPWTRAVSNLTASLANGKHVPEEQSNPLSLRTDVLPALSERQLTCLLYFVNTLAEDINRWSAEPRRVKEERDFSPNVQDAFELVDWVLCHIVRQHSADMALPEEALGTEAISAYQAWLAVRGAIPMRVLVTTGDLIFITAHVIFSMKIPSLSKAATQVVIELVDWRDSILTKEHLQSIMEYIVNDYGTGRVAALMEGDFDDDHMAFLELLLAYGSMEQRELTKTPLDPPHAKMLTLLHTLFKAPGYAGVDDPVASLALEWWTEVADDIQETYMDSEDRTQFQPAKQNLAQAALDCFEKLKYPSSEELSSWGEDDRAEFGSFRRDACDFLLAIYPILGVELVQVFQERATLSLTQQEWRTFEAAIFCLAQLSEAVDENQHADECLNSIFFSSEFERLCGENGVAIPDKPRQTLVDMLGKYQSYFERTHALLPRVLTFLFLSLEKFHCAPMASRSIAHLCNSCRHALTAELPVFLHQFEQFRYKPTATVQAMERVLEGIAAIIQTLPTDEAKAQALEGILKFFVVQAETAREDAGNGLLEASQGRGHLVLRCVASIGKGLRTEGEVNLDANDEDNNPYPPTFWNTTGCLSQHMIMSCIQLLMADFPVDVCMTEAACDILKAGFTERSGPFVFQPSITRGTDTVMATASAFLASHSAHPHLIRTEATRLIVHVYDTFCWMIEKPECYDPEVANSGIDFLTRSLRKYHPFLFELTEAPPGAASDRPSVLNAVLNFTLQSLQGPEPLPLRSASQFWVGVLNLPTDRPEIHNAIMQCLPALCGALMTQIAGRCARSDLEHLNEVLRKVIFKQQGAARIHLSAALGDLHRDHSSPQQGANTPTPEERQRFVASLLAARGARAPTNQLSRDFWIKCRGVSFDYVG
ncbi:importin 13 [Aspergillus heteromorphus CBS 117.55]|uniref:Importin 13 n=1 Tax=Aspergillus heteromorphus CBS 117.55 TaxID=1448321 RepID=A0A317VQL6_9EURO|nr:importin 13 [Aspergillus heteromorphus CBS 117.55]PWY75182.1 importin 13 [Aspergillus heteromorphus CBS 117.55]